MNTEDLKQIVTLLQTVSGDATSVFITYFITVQVLPLLQTVINWVGGYYIAKLIGGVMTKLLKIEKVEEK